MWRNRDTQGEDGRWRPRQRTEWCSHKPVNAWGHQELQEAKWYLCVRGADLPTPWFQTSGLQTWELIEKEPEESWPQIPRRGIPNIVKYQRKWKPAFWVEWLGIRRWPLQGEFLWRERCLSHWEWLRLNETWSGEDTINVGSSSTKSTCEEGEMGVSTEKCAATSKKQLKFEYIVQGWRSRGQSWRGMRGRWHCWPRVSQRIGEGTVSIPAEKWG